MFACVLVFLALTLYCRLVIARTKKIRAALENWLADFGEKDARSGALLDLIEALRYRANLRENRNSTSTAQRLLVSRSQRLLQPPRHGDYEDPRFNHFLHATLLIAKVELISGKEQIVFVGHGSRSENHERRLREHVAPFLLHGRDIPFGLRDEGLSDSLFGGFLKFGFFYTLSLPISGVLKEAPLRQVLWCGWGQDARPPEGEVHRLIQLARELGDEISSKEAIRALSARACTAELGNREKSDFIAHMSHDMRSPLYNVKSIINLLQLEDRAGESVELLEVARSNCESLEELIEDVLDLTRHRAGKLDANLEIFEFGVCVQQVVDNFLFTARSKGLTLEIIPFEGLTPVHADRRQLKRVVSNIISNAIKYTRDGTISVRLLESDREWKLLVKDSGCGMSSAELAQLFKPFSRFQARSIEGIGLGLAISKILVELNGGKIEARSEVHKGSEFEVRFPRSIGCEIKSAAVFSEREPGTSMQHVSVLVVDDDAGCVESLGRLLTKVGCRVLKAYGVRDAMTLINFEVPHCIVSDAQMPEGGALRLLRFVKERQCDCPMLVLSGDDDATRLAEFSAAGVDKVLAKPALFSEIDAWIFAHSNLSRYEGKKACVQ